MRVRYLIFLTGVLMLFSGANVRAEESSGLTGHQCVRKLRRNVHLGNWISVTVHNGDKFEGRLAAIDFAHTQLMLRPIEDTLSAAPTYYEFSDIARLQYRAPGKVRLVYVALGLVAGAALGAYIGGSSYEEDLDAWFDFGAIDASIQGGVIGGVVGIIAGVFVSSSVTSTWTIRCD